MMRATKHRIKLAVAIVGILMLIGVSSAQAATVITDLTDPETAIGILGLRVGNFLFDVTFQTGTSETVYQGLPNFEWDPDRYFNRAVQATDLINDALNTAPGVKKVGDNNNPGNPSYLLGFAEDRGTARFFTFATVGEYSDGDGWILGAGDFQPEPGGPGFVQRDSELSFELWAKYNFVTVVPIPGAVWLLGGGLIGLIGIRRKLRK